MAKDDWGCFVVLLFGYAAFGTILYLLSPMIGAVYIVGMPVLAVCAWKLGGPI